MIWASNQGGVWPRPSIHSQIHEGILKRFRNHSGPQHSIPSSDRWRNGAGESRNWTVLKGVLQLPSKQLGGLASLCRILLQYLETLRYRKISIQGTLWLQSTIFGQLCSRDQGTHGDWMLTADQRSPGRSNGQSTNSSVAYQRPGSTPETSAVESGDPGLVRRNLYLYDTPGI